MADDINTVELATDLTIAWLGNPNTRVNAADVPAFLLSMHQAVAGLGAPAEAASGDEPAQVFTPAVSVRKSLASPDHLISMIDGKPYKSLRRHLASQGLSPEQYRERYMLKADYPMVAAAYSERRRAIAKEIGLGRAPGQSVKAAAGKVANAAREGAAAARAAAKEHLGSPEQS